MSKSFIYLSLLLPLFMHASDELVLESEDLVAFQSENLTPLFEQAPFSTDLITPPEPILQKTKKSTAISVGLSTLIPGLGHTYLGDYGTAGALAGTVAFGYGITSQIKDDSDRVAPLTTLSNIWSYSIYAAYRDTRLYNEQEGYRYQMPNNSFTDLAYAPFRWSVLKKPEVWGGFLGALTLAAGVSYFAYSDTPSGKVGLSTGSSISPLVAFPVGIGEESLFRGFLQPALSESLTPVGGIVVSSLIFGAAHIPNAYALDEKDRFRYYTVSVPFISLLGGYLGWVAEKNHSLEESVAIHSWYDFALFATEAWMSHASTGEVNYVVSFPF